MYNHVPSQTLCRAHIPCWLYGAVSFTAGPGSTRLRPQKAAVSWPRTPAVRVTVEHSAAGLPIPYPALSCMLGWPQVS